jgi:hypothetical protein
MFDKISGYCSLVYVAQKISYHKDNMMLDNRYRVWLENRYIDQWHEIETTELKPHKYSQLGSFWGEEQKYKGSSNKI